MAAAIRAKSRRSARVHHRRGCPPARHRAGRGRPGRDLRRHKSSGEPRDCGSISPAAGHASTTICLLWCATSTQPGSRRHPGAVTAAGPNGRCGSAVSTPATRRLRRRLQPVTSGCGPGRAPSALHAVCVIVRESLATDRRCARGGGRPQRYRGQADASCCCRATPRCRLSSKTASSPRSRRTRHRGGAIAWRGHHPEFASRRHRDRRRMNGSPTAPPPPPCRETSPRVTISSERGSGWSR